MIGAFFPGSAPGAIPNGSKVVKVRTEKGDTHKIGDRATVLSSFRSPEELAHLSKYFYFVEWDDLPGVRVGVAGRKIEVVR